MDNLKKNFGKRKVKEKYKTSLVQNVFTKVSKKYDLMNDIMSFGTHRLWKKILVEMMDIQMNDAIIDVGSGTGDLIKLMLKKNKDVSIYSVDLNFEMLNLAKKIAPDLGVAMIDFNDIIADTLSKGVIDQVTKWGFEIENYDEVINKIKTLVSVEAKKQISG